MDVRTDPQRDDKASSINCVVRSDEIRVASANMNRDMRNCVESVARLILVGDGNGNDNDNGMGG